VFFLFFFQFTVLLFSLFPFQLLPRFADRISRAP